jgi:adhesin/invasin
VSAPTSTSNATGDATIVWTLGATAGENTARAFLANGQSVTFTATGVAGAFASLAMVSGDAQTVTAGAATQPLVVRAVDANGNAVAGVTVTWTSTGGGTLDQTTTTTDAAGMAQVVLTTSAIPGAYTVTATSGAATPITFNGSGT